MDFSLSAEQSEFKEYVTVFAKRALEIGPEDRKNPTAFSMDRWKKCADFGILGLPIPEQYGGGAQDIMNCVLAMETLGYACKDSGLLFSINSHIWTCENPIWKFGTDAQKERYLPALCRGELIGGHAATEPDAGSDVFSIKTSAERRGDRYILNGTKTFITNAPIADLLLVFASTDRSKGFGGLSAFIVEKGFPGFSVSRPFDTMGLKSSPQGEVVLEDCEVPLENLLGREGSGAAIFNSEMEWERGCLFATHLGAMEFLLDTCVQYSKDRRQFGKPIGDYQAISHKLADMRVSIELSRLILYKVASMKGNGQRAHLESSIAKLFISESYVKLALDALQIHGAYGFSEEFGIERHLRDAVAGKIYSGTSEVQRNIIANHMGL
jgi:alkylation response protein AidB-like acyl-CoA dehydrogenase